ncbi:MAG TPA: cation ABC transporter substrate-binding protein [Leucothrix mucor]|nr:cation ABC transporter substrate-binding protein [Leucothrix mucor]
MKRLFTILTICFFSLLLSTQWAFANDKPTVFVSIVPQKFFVQQIGKDHVNVEVMVKPGASPATYEPKSSQMRQLASASAYFSIGVPFEHAWLDKISKVNPEMKVVHTDEGITKLTMSKKKKKAKEKEHKEKSHDHKTGLDVHIWLSPLLVKIQAATVTDALVKILPEKKALFQQNFDLFAKKIDTLDNDLHTIFKEKKGMKFMVFHPSWGYFAHDYGLQQVAVEVEGKNPKPAQLQKTIEKARKDDIHVIFVQPQFSTKNATVVAREIKGEVIPINPLAEDWLSNMRVVADKFQSALR